MSDTLFLDDLPLVDLHRHLDGIMRLETILEVARRYDLPLPADTVAGLESFIVVREPVDSLPDFFERFALFQQTLVNYDVVYRVARENLEIALSEGLDYVELRFSPLFMVQAHHLDPRQVVRTVCPVSYTHLTLPTIYSV